MYFSLSPMHLGYRLSVNTLGASQDDSSSLFFHGWCETAWRWIPAHSRAHDTSGARLCGSARQGACLASLHSQLM